ncbi:MAG: hypothetical protein M1330_01835 [Armatimonadetes bacterium]|nr:hypothetical protein [Armatimonadota bacterium]
MEHRPRTAWLGASVYSYSSSADFTGTGNRVTATSTASTQCNKYQYSTQD